MKKVLFFVAIATFAVVSCNKSPEAEKPLQVSYQEIEDCPTCCTIFWNCVEGSDGSQSELIACFEGYKGCNAESVLGGNETWFYVPEWTAFPEEIDFNAEDITFEFKLYDLDNEEYVSNPSSYISSIEITAIGINSSFEADGLENLGSAALDGDTYTLTVDGADLVNEFYGLHAINFRVRIGNSSIPTISGANTGGNYLYANVPVLIAQ